MSVRALGQPMFFASYAGPLPVRPRTRSGPPIGTPEIFVPALCSAVGLLASIPYLPLLSKALADEDTFSLLTAFLR